MAKKKEFPNIAAERFQEGYESEPEVTPEVPFDEKTLPRQTYYLTPFIKMIPRSINIPSGNSFSYLCEREGFCP